MKKQTQAELETKLKKVEREKSKLHKENSKLKMQLAREDSLWGTELGKNRHTSVQPAKLLHIHETLDYIIANNDLLYALTRNTKKLFDDTLKDLLNIIKKSKDAPHFRDDTDRNEDPGNQCNLYVRHFLLMDMIRKAQNLTQAALGAFFGIDQGTVSRYLKFANLHNDELYIVTPNNITDYIATLKSKKKFKEIVPGKDGGELTVDGTLVAKARPADKDERKKQYSGKKKTFAISTAMLINKDRYIVGISDSREGSCHDLKVLTEGLPDFGKWLDYMTGDKDVPDTHRIRLNADGGYIGIEQYLAGITAKLPYKKPKGGELTSTQKALNKAHSRRRVPVEHVFAHVKNWKRIAGRYDGTAEEFNVEFNGICGMYNKRKMWADGTYHYWKDKILNSK